MMWIWPIAGLPSMASGGLDRPASCLSANVHFSARGNCADGHQKFVLYSFVGAVPFCYALAYVGLKMGSTGMGCTSISIADLVIGLFSPSASAIFSGHTGRSVARLWGND